MNDSYTGPAVVRSAPPRSIAVWDPLVRFGHWTLLVAFFTAYFTEDDFMTAHVWAGYTVATLIVVRLLWGFVGTRHARFSDFVRSPGDTLRYLRSMLGGRARRYIGHNPAGAAMVLALLLGLGGTAVAGFMLYAIEEDAGPLAYLAADTATGAHAGAPGLETLMPVSPAWADDDDGDARDGRGESAGGEDREEFWEEVHEFFANFTLLLIIVHVLGVLYSSYLHDENLPLAMLTGRKRVDD